MEWKELDIGYLETWVGLCHSQVGRSLSARQGRMVPPRGWLCGLNGNSACEGICSHEAGSVGGCGGS